MSNGNNDKTGLESDQNTPDDLSRRDIMNAATSAIIATSIGGLVGAQSAQAQEMKMMRPDAVARPGAAGGTINKIEDILKNIVSQPLETTESQLNSLADSTPQDAGPLLALTVVTVFSQPERLSEGQQILARAKQRLGTATDAESAFSRALANAISAQFAAAGSRAAGGSAAETLTALRTAANNLHSSQLAQDITGAILALSLNGGATHSEGVELLTPNAGSSDLAAFFLVYAHRRAGQYPQALDAARQLEARAPNSSLVKKIIGSCYFFSHNLKQAESYYRQAINLNPQDPGAHLGLANILDAAGDKAGAKQSAATASKLDMTGRLSSYTARFNK